MRTLEERKRLFKKCLPAGSKAEGNALLLWTKHGGHAGARSAHRAVDKLLALGFAPLGATPAGNADGSSMGSDRVYVNEEGDRLALVLRYGATAHDNRFSISIQFKE